MNTNFVQALNNMRVEGSAVLHDSLPEITSSSDIAKWSEVIFTNPQVYSEFCDGLVSKLIKTQLEVKLYKNKFNIFNGEDIPFGYSMENAYTNPAIGTDYDPNDFAGILARYEADTKVEYFKVNSDKQYKVTVYRDELRKAMLSLEALARYITNLTNSLYNGAYIDMKRRTIGIVGSAYENNRVHIETISAVTDKATAEAFAVKARTLFLNFQEESDEYNSWKLNGGEGRPIITWTDPDDIYIIVKNSVLAEMDVKSLANAFNMDEAKLMGKVIGVNNFSTYDSEGNVVSANSNVVAVMCDRRFFKIHQQEMYLEPARNASARATTYFLNVIKSYNMSMFANCVVFATSLPTIAVTDIEFKDEAPTVKIGKNKVLEIETTPETATSTITYTSSDTGVATVTKVDNRSVKVTGVSAGTATITATDGGSVSGTVTLTVEPTKLATDLDFAVSEVTIAPNGESTQTLTITPSTANENIVFEASNTKVTLTKISNTSVKITAGASTGTSVVSAKSKNCTAQLTVTIAS